MAARGRLRSRNILKYSAYGLTISSEFPLPELLPCVGPSKPQIFIRKGRLPSTRRGVGNSLRATARIADFFWKGESAIRVSNGEEITVDTFPGADEKAVRLSILGPAFFQLLVQKKFFVLHASAVNVNGKAVAFVGGSGAGKSTLAAAFHAKGSELITDNWLALRFSKEGPVVFPAFPQFKLWPDSAKVLGLDPEKLPWIDSVTEKHSLCFKSRFTRKPVPLQCIYFLSKGEKAQIRQMFPSQKLLELISHSSGTIPGIDNRSLSSNFLHCARLIKAVPMCSLQRDRSLASLPRLVKMAEEDLVSDRSL